MVQRSEKEALEPASRMFSQESVVVKKCSRSSPDWSKRKWSQVYSSVIGDHPELNLLATTFAGNKRRSPVNGMKYIHARKSWRYRSIPSGKISLIYFAVNCMSISLAQARSRKM